MGAAYEAGAVRRQLPLDRIAPWLEAFGRERVMVVQAEEL